MCEFCENYDDYIKDKKMRNEPYEMQMSACFFVGKELMFSIKYCPLCGKQLEMNENKRGD